MTIEAIRQRKNYDLVPADRVCRKCLRGRDEVPFNTYRKRNGHLVIYYVCAYCKGTVQKPKALRRIDLNLKFETYFRDNYPLKNKENRSEQITES